MDGDVDNAVKHFTLAAKVQSGGLMQLLVLE